MTELWSLYQEDRSIEIRNKIVEIHLPLVTFTAKKLKNQCMITKMELDDLSSYGIFGLIAAVEKYNPSLGFKFSTYATFRIKGSILDELRKIDWVPRSVRKKINDIKADIKVIEENQENHLTDFDLYKLYHLTDRELNVLKDRQFVSMHLKNGEYLIDFIADFEDPNFC